MVSIWGMSSRWKPNPECIQTTDLGFSDIGCFGAEISTPNIDRLAKEGVRFSDCKRQDGTLLIRDPNLNSLAQIIRRLLARPREA